MTLQQITDDLVAGLDGLRFGLPVTHVYNPLVYARGGWDLYCEKYGQGRREVLVVGMNPGPFGMAQCGVPFGEIAHVRDWLGVEAPIGRPPIEHPKRPIQGFDCPRSEVSGSRLWGWAKETYVTPEAFFGRFFVWNYCPLVFMEEGGRNRVPEKLPRAEREPVFAACDEALWRAIERFEPRLVLGVGRFAERRAIASIRGRSDAIVASVPHPSPASPLANKGWSPLMNKALRDLGFMA